MIILKYKIPFLGFPEGDLDPANIIEMPIDSKVLAVGHQKPHNVLWVEAPRKDGPMVDRKFWVIGTGWEVDGTGHRMSYVGTILEDEGRFIWHVYEETSL